MIREVRADSGSRLRGYQDPRRVHPPRKGGMRPGTAAGTPQTLF